MKRSNQSVTTTIDITAAQAWAVIGAVKGVDQWLAPIQACRVEGDKRYCTTEQGEFSEDILEVNHEQQVFRYHIAEQNMMPISNINGRMQVRAGAENQAEVEWSWEFDVAEDQEAEAKEMLATVGNMGITGIETLVKTEASQAA